MEMTQQTIKSIPLTFLEKCQERGEMIAMRHKKYGLDFVAALPVESSDTDLSSYDITKGAWEDVYLVGIGRTIYFDENNEALMKYKTAFAKYYPEERWGSFAFECGRIDS